MAFTINEFVFKVILPILVGVAILTSLNSIKTESLDPKVDSLEDVLGSMGRSVTFADNSGNPWDETSTTKAEFRDAVVYNMFIAQNCRFIPRIDGMEAADNFEGISSGEVYYPLGLEKPFTTQKNQGELSSTCAGGKPVLQLPEINFQTGLEDKEGNDMEGRYGRVTFNLKQNFTLENPKIAGFYFDIPDTQGPFSNAPDLWRGKRMVTAVPAELSYTCGDSASDLSLYPAENQGGGTSARDASGSIGKPNAISTYGGGEEGFFAYRLRISESVPKIKEGSDIPGSSQMDLCGSPENNQLKKFLVGGSNSEPMKYVFCSGATGYIQSNAGRIANGGEAANSGIEFGPGSDFLVFPKITVRSNADRCITHYIASGPVVGPKLPAGSNPTCSFREVKQMADGNYRDWKGTRVKCGLRQQEITQPSGGSFTYYNTVWHLKENKCYSGGGGSYTKRLYSEVSGSVSETQQGLILDGNPASVRYNLQRVGPDKIKLVFEANEDSSPPPEIVTVRLSGMEEEDITFSYSSTSSDERLRVRKGSSNVIAEKSKDLPRGKNTVTVDLEAGTANWEKNGQKFFQSSVNLGSQDLQPSNLKITSRSSSQVQINELSLTGVNCYGS